MEDELCMSWAVTCVIPEVPALGALRVGGLLNYEAHDTPRPGRAKEIQGCAREWEGWLSRP